MGKRLGISQSAYGIYERGGFRPSIKMASKIAKALEVSLDYLTGNLNVDWSNDMIIRIQEINNLNEEDRKRFFLVVNDLIG